MTKINSTTVIVRGESTLRNANVDANICFRAEDGVTLQGVKVRSNPNQYQVTCDGAEYLGCTEYPKPTPDDWRAMRAKKPSGLSTNNVMDDSNTKTSVANSEGKKEPIYLSGVVARVKIGCVDTVIVTNCRIGTLSLQNVGRVIIGGDTTVARVATCSVKMVSIGEYSTSPVHIGKLVVRDALATTIAGDANVVSGNINSALTILEGRATLGS